MSQNGDHNMSIENSSMKNILVEAISGTIEEMVFHAVDEVLEECPEQSDEEVWAFLPLLEPLEGELFFIIPNEFARSLTETIYAVEDESLVTDEMVNDLVAELVNTIGGKFMASLLPPDKTFKLGLPKTGRGEYPEMDVEAVRIACKIDDHDLCAVVSGFDYAELIKEEK